VRKFVVAVALISLAVLGMSAPGRADTITVTTGQSRFNELFDNQGWWDATFVILPTLRDNYIVGRCCESGEHRDFFTFDLSGLTLTAVSASLEVRRFDGSSPDAFEMLGLFEVTTDAAALNANNGDVAAIFADLGDGTSFGTFDIPTLGDRGAIVSLPLNADGVAAINRSRGHFFSIGGRILTLGTSTPNEFLFGNSTGAPSGGFSARLVVTAFPLPAQLDDCKSGGWSTHTDAHGTSFRNQGQCVAFVNHRP
jgi:hypothetical protein